MYDFILPRNGPVVDGLEEREVVYAADQPKYNPLRTLVSVGRECRVISRWTPTDEQRKAIADGADIFLELLTFGHPLQPIRMAVSDGKLDTNWVRVCLLDESVGVQGACDRIGQKVDDVLAQKKAPPGPPDPPRPPNDHPVG